MGENSGYWFIGLLLVILAGVCYLLLREYFRSTPFQRNIRPAAEQNTRDAARRLAARLHFSGMDLSEPLVDPIVNLKLEIAGGVLSYSAADPTDSPPDLDSLHGYTLQVTIGDTRHPQVIGDVWLCHDVEHRWVWGLIPAVPSRLRGEFHFTGPDRGVVVTS